MMGASMAQQLLLLVVVLAPLSQRLRLAAAECDLPSWSSWEQLDLGIDAKPKELVIQTLKVYVKGLEQAAGDLQCGVEDWAAEDSSSKISIKSACLKPGAQEPEEYAVSFSYSVDCNVTSASLDEGGGTGETEEVKITGAVEGVLTGANLTGETAERLTVEQKLVEEAPSVESNAEIAAKRRILFMTPTSSSEAL